MNQIIQNEELNKEEQVIIPSNENNPSISEDENTINLETNLEEPSSEETEVIKPEEANTSNCLALTIQKEHKLVAVKNVFLHSLKVSWKVVVSAITLHILKLFF